MSQLIARSIFYLGLFAALTFSIAGAQAFQPPRSGMAAPPVETRTPDARFDPSWVSHRGQVVLFLYVTEEGDLPPETIDRIVQWQSDWGPKGLVTVVMVEGEATPPGLSTDIILVRDRDSLTRDRYQVIEDREYFMVDRWGRLRRERISPRLVERALAENFDPAWIGYSAAWNQSYFVHEPTQRLLYLADTLPDTAIPGDPVDFRLIALPTFSEPVPGTQIHNPIQVEVQADEGFEQNIYRFELPEDVQISTELLGQVKVRPDAEPGLHVLRAKVRHRHCGFGNCGSYEATVPIPIWVE
jgi:hypothetical protein